jgi:hypothetical protein
MVPATEGKHALLAIPGLGCGQFAGPFAGQLGAELQAVLERFLTQHGASFPHIKAVYYGPYNECSNSRQNIHGISLMVRPLFQGRPRNFLSVKVFRMDLEADFKRMFIVGFGC